jgi:hypothetical protein
MCAHVRVGGRVRVWEGMAEVIMGGCCGYCELVLSECVCVCARARACVCVCASRVGEYDLAKSAFF